MTHGSVLGRFTVAAAVWIPLVWAGCSSDGAGPSDAGVPDGITCGDDLDHVAMLECLGVDTALGPLTDPNGDTVREDYNPLTTKRRNLHRRAEIYIAGLEADTGFHEHLWDDESWDVLYRRNETSPSWLEWPKVSAAGDLDGDGAEEIAIAIVNNRNGHADYGKLWLRIINDKRQEYTTVDVPLATLTAPETARFGPQYDGLARLDIAVGDLDGDGNDEIAVVALGYLWVVDDQKAAYESLWTHTYPTSWTEQYVRVTAGDVDSDGKEETIVTNGGFSGNAGSVTYYIYDEEFETEIEPQLIETTIGEDTYQLMTADVSVADIDGDRLMEVVFAGRQSEVANHYEVLVLDDFTQGYEFRPTHFGYAHSLPLARLETGDFDGDGVSEIVSYRHVLTGSTLEPQTDAYVPRDLHYGLVMSVGDVNGDFRDDIVLEQGGGDYWMHVWGRNDEDEWALLYSKNTGQTNWYTTVTTVDIDNDSAILEYVGHELLFTNPLVTAVAVAPPAYADIDTHDESGTTIGRSTGTSQEYETALGFTAGFTFGYEQEFSFFGIPLGSARWTTTIETAVDWISTSSLEIEKAYFYNGSGETDKVVFTTIPYDVYYYTVVSSPVADDVGMPVVLNIPREPKTLFVDRDFYNAYNGDAPDVDEDVLDHVIGDPSSYPRAYGIDCAGLETSGGFCSDDMTVGQGPGSQTIEISVSEGQGSGTSFDLSVTTEVETVTGGIVMGASAGFHYGHSYSITSTESTYYAGEVANILDADDWTANMFDFGLYVQPTEVGDQKFPVVGYWVD